MSALFESIKSAWTSYSLTTLSLILYWLALVWLFLFEKRKNILFWYAVVVSVLLVGMEAAGYYLFPNLSLLKMFYLLPTGILLCYAAVKIAEGAKGTSGEKKTWIIVLLYAIMIQAGITMKYDGAVLQGGMNSYKVSTCVEWMAYYINEDESLTNPYVLAPGKIVSQIQEFDVNIRVAYGEGYSYTAADIDGLLTKMDEYGCNCLIVSYNEDEEDYIKQKGYRLVVIHDDYAIYARK